MRGRLLKMSLATPALLLLGVFLVLPYAEMVSVSLHATQPGKIYGTYDGLDQYRRVLSEPLYLGALTRSLVTAACITVACLGVSYPVAWHMSRARGLKALVLYVCVASPLIVGVLIRNFGWMIVLNVDGPLNRVLLWSGVVDRPLRLLFTPGIVWLALIHVFMPFMVLPINNALRNINPALIEASTSLGAGPLSTLSRVVLPLSFPGVQPGLILVFVLATAAYVTPALLGGQMVTYMSTLVVQALTGTLDWPLGATLAVVLATSTLLVVVAFTAATYRLLERTRA